MPPPLGLLTRLFQRRPAPAAAAQAEGDTLAPYVLAISMVKNEQDIIEPFLRHTAGMADCLVLLDNDSVDSTRDIAVACARDLGNVLIADSLDFGYTQAERMTRLLHHAQTAFFADFVLPLDADEFLGVPDRAALLAALSRVPLGGMGLAPWRNFVVRPEDAQALADDPPAAIRWRRSIERPEFRKAFLRLDGRLPTGLTIAQGNHAVLGPDGAPLPAVNLDTLPLLHFPVRSLRQIRAKGVVGWAASLARDPDARKHDLAFQWRDAFDAVVAGRLHTAEDLARVSAGYAVLGEPPSLVEDPPSFRPERRHSSGTFADELVLVARSWEKSLSAPGLLLDALAPNRDAAGGERAAATAFTAEWHWQNLFVDVAPFRAMAEILRPASVLDVGCGVGAYLELFRRCGAETLRGLDGVPADGIVLRPDEYAVTDLAGPIDLGRRFDLVICTEVAEHLDAASHEVLVETIDRHAVNTMIFSAAEPGQPGHGHISCVPVATWLDRWVARGWWPDVALSCGMRCLATLSWFRRNLLVLRRGGPRDPAAMDRLRAIGAKPFQWYGQVPGIRHFPFTEPLPPPPDGYADP